MATYLIQLLNPFGQSIFDSRLESEESKYPDMSIDDLTGLMMTPEGELQSSGRFVIKGGRDPRAAYSLQVTRQD